MWQVPSDEINRPGSFSSHARRNLELLLRILSDLKDAQTLLQLAQHLKSRPDPNKQYLRDNERVAIHVKVRWREEGGREGMNDVCMYVCVCVQVVKLCVQVLVGLGKEEVGLTVEEAEKYKNIGTAIRSMAHRLDSSLNKVNISP